MAGKAMQRELAARGESYKATALAEVQRRKLTLQTASTLEYEDVAGLAGVKIGADGSSPADFFWRGVRGYVVAQLRRQAEAARQELLRAALEKEAKKANSGAIVQVGGNGVFEVIG